MIITSEKVKTIGVFRALQLGDLLCTIPALRALRGLYPQAHITLIGLPWQRELVERYPHYLDSFVHFPGYPGLPEQTVDVRAVWEFVRQQQARPFDLLLQMQGKGATVNPFLSLWGAHYLAGFYPKNGVKLSPYFTVYPERGHEITRMLRLMTFLGARAIPDDLEFPLYPHDIEAMRAVVGSFTSPGFVGIHIGARDPKRRWSLNAFASLAKAIHEKGWGVVLTGVTAEAAEVKRLETRLDFPVVNVVGRTPLGAMAALIKETALFISNDTGVAHLAVAVGARSIMISLNRDSDRWNPLKRIKHWVINGFSKGALAETKELVAKLI